jgi:hypothetical protein
VWASFASDAAGKSYRWLDTENGTIYIPADRDDEWVWLRSARTPTTFFDEEARAYAEATHTICRDRSSAVRAGVSTGRTMTALLRLRIT